MEDIKSRIAPIKTGFSKIKDFFKDDIEEYLRENATYAPILPIKSADVAGFLANYELKLIGMGIYNRVYKIEDRNWVVKEARWDASIEFFKKHHISFPSVITEKLLSLFDYSFLPRTKQIFKDFKEYLEFAQYFGYFTSEDDYYHPNLDLMLITQKNLRNSLMLFKPEIEKEYSFKIENNIDEILNSDIIYHNFLPKEYLLIGKSFSKPNKNKDTAYIFQEFIKGDPIRNISKDDMNSKQRKTLILLVYLILLMHMQIRLLPDTRPRYHVFEVYDWLTKTDNIFVNEDGLFFIDTRWFWDSRTNLVKRGLLIPNLIIKRCKTTLNLLLQEEKKLNNN